MCCNRSDFALRAIKLRKQMAERQMGSLGTLVAYFELQIS